MIRCVCGGKTIVRDTRPLDDGIWRRRICTTCKASQTTFEQQCITDVQPQAQRIGSKGRGKRTVDKPPVVTIDKHVRSQPPGPRGKAPAVTHIPCEVVAVKQATRNRIEDLRMQRELEAMD